MVTTAADEWWAMVKFRYGLVSLWYRVAFTAQDMATTGMGKVLSKSASSLTTSGQ